ncbi:hypothetical protein [Bacillus sp. SD088]|uniref:hypothetical protein n=1 Tax=Bacillus sp. SD088 TaxID=2782012 RepID=UPI001A970576|nr:hypothetical protein [Bacillus sp. SD088]MBO0995608.1 hypothetical protein [Bacillus sp. SD088]
METNKHTGVYIMTVTAQQSGNSIGIQDILFSIPPYIKSENGREHGISSFRSIQNEACL